MLYFSSVFIYVCTIVLMTSTYFDWTSRYLTLNWHSILVDTTLWMFMKCWQLLMYKWQMLWTVNSWDGNHFLNDSSDASLHWQFDNLHKVENKKKLHSLLDLCHLFHIWNGYHMLKVELLIDMILLTYALSLVWVLELEGRERSRQGDSRVSLIYSNCLLSCRSDMDNKPNHNNLKMVGNLKYYILHLSVILYFGFDI